MKISDHEEIRIEGLRGYYSRGGPNLVPRDHCITANNVEWDGRAIRPRRGYSQLQATTYAAGTEKVVRIYRYARSDGNRIIVLTDARKFYDLSSATPSTPILTIGGSGTMDASVLSVYNRLYISPHDGTVGLSGEFVYVYNGTGTARKAAGVAPTSGTFAAATSATAGNVESGIHLIAVVYETDSGFVTKPGPATFLVYTAPGSFKIDLTNIPTGPSGTAKRKILASKTILDPVVNATNQENYELFFVPNGTINDNTTTSLTIDFFDSNLKDSADYLLDELTEIPAVCALGTYGTSMIAAGAYGQESVVRVSKGAEPESYSAIDGFVLCAPQDGGGVHAVRELRSTLYMFKSSRTYASQATGVTPADWPLDLVDSGYGAEVFGVADVLDSSGTSQDTVVTIDKSGLRLFNGTYSVVPLTWKIEDFWRTLVNNNIASYEIILDPTVKQIYVLICAIDGTAKSRVLMGDYNEGLTPDKIRWAVWSFNGLLPTAIMVKFNESQLRTNLVIGSRSSSNYIYYIDSITGVWSDNNQNTGPVVDTALMPEGLAGVLNHFNYIGVDGNGTGALQMSLIGITQTYTPAPITMTAGPINNMFRTPVDLANQEKVYVRLTMNTRPASTDVYFSVNSVFVYAKPQFIMRPF